MTLSHTERLIVQAHREVPGQCTCVPCEHCGAIMRHVEQLLMAGTVTRMEQIKEWEARGRIDPACAFCQREFYARTTTMPSDVFAPSHKASEGCESGKRSHCTCDTCF